MRLADIIQRETLNGDRVEAGRLTVIPEWKALTIRWPKGGMVWRRPIAVLVEGSGQTERLPITDVTRRAQWALYGLSILFSMIALVLSAVTFVHHRKKEGTA